MSLRARRIYARSSISPRLPSPSHREKLNTLEKKLRIFKDLDSSKADERVSVGEDLVARSTEGSSGGVDRFVISALACRPPS